MKELVKLTTDFETSRPVFRLQLNEDGSRIDVDTNDAVYKYKPTPVEDDILSRLVCENYNEHFNIRDGKFSIDKFAIANRAMEDIRGAIAKFVEKNLEMKNPRQSKLYRWTYRSMPNSTGFNDTLVMLYKYLRSFTNDDMRMTMGSLDHVRNGLAILEAMMEKHEQ